MTGAQMTGHCLCGAVTVRVAGGHDPRPGACHCRMCQRWSGGLFLCFNADADGVAVDGPIARHASSDFAERAFCSVCGSHLWMRDRTANTYDLMPDSSTKPVTGPCDQRSMQTAPWPLSVWKAITAAPLGLNMKIRINMLQEMRHDL